MLRTILSDLGKSDRFYYIGPGILGREIDWRLAARSSIVIVEPDPVAAAKYQSEARNVRNFQILDRVLTDHPGKGAFLRYNFAHLNSVNPIAPDAAEFPGASVVSRRAVDVMGSAEFEAIAGQDDRNGNDVLVLEATGGTGEALAVLIAVGVVARCNRIILRAPSREFFGKENLAAQLSEKLVEAGFLEPVVLDRSVPEFPVLTFLRSQMVDELKERSLREQSAMQDKLKAREAALEAAEKQRARAEREAEARTRDLSVAMRLQLAAQTDLANLQEQYAGLLEEKKSLDSLLERVTQKLRAASQHWHAVSGPDDPAAQPLLDNDADDEN